MFYEKLTGKIIIHNLRPSWLIFADGFAKNSLKRTVKRSIDILLAAVGLCIALPKGHMSARSVLGFLPMDKKGSQKDEQGYREGQMVSHLSAL